MTLLLSVFTIAEVLMASTGTLREGVGEPERKASGQLIQARDVVAIQDESTAGREGRYDWGPSVMRDEGIYRMWWTRFQPPRDRRFSYQTVLPDGEAFEFTYPDQGDRIYYAESRDGIGWRISGGDFEGSPEGYGPDSQGGLMVLRPAQTTHEYYHLGRPSVIKVGGRFFMYYEAPGAFVVNRGTDGKITVGDEFQNQVFLATSTDGKRWTKYPDDEHPEPIIRAPENNLEPGRRRYGLGQPSACYRNGRFIMHYVDACTGPGDFIVRIEADNPEFRNPERNGAGIAPVSGGKGIPRGSVARFAQTDVRFLGDAWYLVRPAYGTGNLGILAARTGVFEADAGYVHPKDVFPQLTFTDPLGPAWTERLFPGFLTTPEGEILLEDGMAVIYFSSGLGWKEKAYSWDLRRCRVELEPLLSNLSQRGK